MISHKFREVKAFCDGFTVLRRGRLAGAGHAQKRERRRDEPHDDRRHPDRASAPSAQAQRGADRARPRRPLSPRTARARRRSRRVNLKVKAGEIVGIAGVSGNGQCALVEVLAGQKPLPDGRIFINGEPFEPKRADFDRFKVFGLPEEPLKNATVPRHEGGGKHRLPHLRQAADRQPGLVAVAGADAQEGARS